MEYWARHGTAQPLVESEDVILEQPSTVSQPFDEDMTSNPPSKSDSIISGTTTAATSSTSATEDHSVSVEEVLSAVRKFEKEDVSQPKR